MSTAEALAKLIRQRYDQSPPGKWPMEDSLAEFILEHAGEFGLAVIQLPEPDRENPRVWRGSFGGMSCYVTKAGTVGTPDGSITVAEARADAAALLAAAAAAEAVTQ